MVIYMYIFRADGNAKIGAGHLMRCLTIADAIPDKEQIMFLCADSESAALPKQKGYYALILGTDYRKMESELPILKEAIGNLVLKDSETMQHVILVDSYFVTDNYLHILRQYGSVVLLDDMASQAYPVDAVVNYNVFASADRYDTLYKGIKNTEYFIGKDYVPVRSEFLLREYAVRNRVNDILITTGGGDIDNIASQILDVIYDERIDFHIITGKFNPHFKALKEIEKLKKGVYIHCNVTDMAGMMERCDLAITAGGTTIYELASVGVPFICFSYAENQEALTQYIGKQDIAGYAGAYHKEPKKTLNNIQKLCREFIDGSEYRNKYSMRAIKMTDGLGAKRLADLLKEKRTVRRKV